MKKVMLLTALLVVAAACEDDGGLVAPFTETGTVRDSTNTRTRAIMVRGVVSGNAGQALFAAGVRVTAVPVDVNGACTGTPTVVDVTTGSNGEYRAQVRVNAQVITMCVTVTATPPAGSALRGSTIDAGRLSPAVESPGAAIPERIINFALTT
jgi:hypothetical protein